MTGCVDGRISFCVTCKNRLWQLRQTFPGNLQAVVADGNSELVLVNYNSCDELDAWIRQFQSYIDSGVVRYIHERTEPFFHCSKAKNLAHLGATGEFLVNLDGDNFIGDTIPAWRQLWTQCYDTLIHGFSADCHGHFDQGNGTFGRIGLPRKHFAALGGYDEQMLPVSCQDSDLIDRARASGIAIVRRSQPAPLAIRNSTKEKIKYCGSALSWEQMWHMNIEHARKNLQSKRLVVNHTRTRVRVWLNFSEEIEL